MKFISKKDIKIPKRNKDSKKGNNGRVLIIGGSKEYVGAVALAGLAALRSGCDWVTIAAPEHVAWAINVISPDLVTFKLKGNYISMEHINDIEQLITRHDVVLLGNGIEMQPETIQLLKKIIKNINIPKVIDADGIKILSIDDLENSIITPHVKELEIFLSNSKINKSYIKKIINEENIKKKSILIKNNLKNFLNKENIILLKGPIDTIISKNKIYYNKTGNAGMSKAGTGDVLAGLTAGFLAQNKDLLQSSIDAAHFNGLIGDILMKRKKGFTYLASDMVDEINKVCK